jgi:hypothetical protein
MKKEGNRRINSDIRTSIKTAVRPPRQARDFQQAHGRELIEGLKTNRNSKQMRLNCRAQRHHYSMFNVDGFVKSPKRANFQISHLMISIGYKAEI